ncbi:MAG: response regulator [Opitutaceae bacterium]
MLEDPSLPSMLLVEDDEDDVYFLKRALGEAGIRNPLYVIADGQEAIDYLSGGGAYADRDRFPLPALVFLDLKLPLKSGHEVLEWMRHHGFESTTVVVISTSDLAADIRTAYRLGANSYVVKSFAREKLRQLAESIKSYWLVHHRFA